MNAPVLESASAEVQILVQPIDPEADFRRSCALTECYAGFLKPDGGDGGVGANGGKNKSEKPPDFQEETEGDGGGNGTTDAREFEALEWQRQPFLKAAGGALEWIRLASDGRVQKGVKCAQECQPERELCGWTIRPRLQRLHSLVSGEGAAGSADLVPKSPANEPVLEWEALAGQTWERLIPAREPLWGAIRHREAIPNQVVRLRTTQNLPRNAALCIVFDVNGQIQGHKDVPAIRLEWGKLFSFVLRGMDGSARPCLEERNRNPAGNPKWELWSRLDNAPPLDESFWQKGRYVLRLYRLGGRLIVEWNGSIFWVIQLADKQWQEHGDKPRPIPVKWDAAPLQLSISGVDCLVQVGLLNFNRMAWFAREASVGAGPSESGTFGLSGAGSQEVDIGHDHSNIPWKGRGRLQGARLQDVQIEGKWTQVETHGRVNYDVLLRGDSFEPPLLSSLAIQLPPTATHELPDAIDLRPALMGLTLSSGEPGNTPSAEARFDVEPALLDRFYPGWQNVLVPFRPVEVKARETTQVPWVTLFKGYLLPDSNGQDGYNAHHVAFIARDKMLRLQSPAALIDDRFGPLDLFMPTDNGALYGVQGVQHLLGIELGKDEADTFNGNNDPFRFLQSGHYPLMGDFGNDVFELQGMPQSGNFRLPPPYGEDLKRWIDQIAEYDHAIWYYDPMEEGFVYGHIRCFFAERGTTRWHLRGATTEFPGGDDSPAAWPLLSQYGRTGWLEHAYTGTQVWGMVAPGMEGMSPALIVGRYEPNSILNDLNPLSETQSWRRTLLLKQDFIGDTADQVYADSQAYRMWQEFGGQLPRRFDFTISDGSTLRARWGEIVQWQGEDLRIVSVEHSFSFGQSSERLVTHLTARSLSATGL